MYKKENVIQNLNKQTNKQKQKSSMSCITAHEPRKKYEYMITAYVLFNLNKYSLVLFNPYNK